MVERVRLQYLRQKMQWLHRGRANVISLGTPRFLPNWPDGFEARHGERFMAIMDDDSFIESVIGFHEASTREPTHMQVLRHAVNLASTMAFIEEIALRGE